MQEPPVLQQLLQSLPRSLYPCAAELPATPPGAVLLPESLWLMIEEKCMNQLHDLYTVFMTKVLGTVSKEGLWRIKSKIGCPDKVIAIAHQGMTAGVRDGREQTDFLPVTNGVKLGCVLAQTLFSMFSAKQNHAAQTVMQTLKYGRGSIGNCSTRGACRPSKSWETMPLETFSSRMTVPTLSKRCNWRWITFL